MVFRIFRISQKSLSLFPLPWGSMFVDFPGGTSGKEATHPPVKDARDAGSIWVGKIPWSLVFSFFFFKTNKQTNHFYWSIVALQYCVSFNWSTFCSLVFVLLLVSFSQFNANICAMLLLQSCLTLCNPMDCSLPGFSVHRILQARILQRVVMPSFRGSSQPRDRTHIS